MAERQLRDRLDHGAEVTIRTLADEVARLQSMVDGGLPPEKTFRGLPADGSWAYVERHDAKLQVYPPNILPYELGAPPEAAGTDPDLQRAEQLEAQDLPERAIATYRDLLATAHPALVPIGRAHV